MNFVTSTLREPVSFWSKPDLPFLPPSLRIYGKARATSLSILESKCALTRPLPICGPARSRSAIACFRPRSSFGLLEFLHRLSATPSMVQRTVTVAFSSKPTCHYRDIAKYLSSATWRHCRVPKASSCRESPQLRCSKVVGSHDRLRPTWLESHESRFIMSIRVVLQRSGVPPR